HDPTKEAVLDETVKDLVTAAHLPREVIPWQERVRRFATALRTLARRHPPAFDAFHHVPAQGEPAAAALEAGLAAFRRAGFDAVTAYNATKATGVAVLGLVLDDTARLRSGDRRTDLSGLPDERFPHIREFVSVAEQ